MANGQGTSGGKWIAIIAAFLTIVTSIAAVGSFIIDVRGEVRAIKSETMKNFEKQNKKIESAKQDIKNTEQEIQNIKKEIAIKSLVADAFKEIEIAAVKGVEERERLKLLAQKKEVQGLFTPFLKKGYQQLDSNCGGRSQYKDGISYYKLDIATPLSFAGLKCQGAFLNPKRLLELATDKNNDRPPWAATLQSEEEFKELQKLFELFKKVAPIWVEMGLLVR